MQKNLITLNIYSSNSYRIENYLQPKKHISFQKIDKRLKNDFVVSFIGNSDMFYERVEINSNIPDSEIIEAIKSKIYEELDNSINYTILYSHNKKQDENKREFSVFVINPNIFKYVSKQINKKIGYIHQIYPIPLLLKELYNFSGKKETREIFIYIYRDSTSLSIFDNGELLYTKGLNFSLLLFYDIFLKALQPLEIGYTLFSTIITNKSILNRNYRYKRALTIALKHFFDEVFEIINYIKRSLKLEDINSIFITSELGEILGSIEYSHTFLNIETKDSFLKRFNIPIDSTSPKDEMHKILYLAQELYLSEFSYITILEPPPNFFLRDSGQLITVTILSFILSISYPLYNHIKERTIFKNIEKKRIESIKLENKYKIVSSNISELKKKRFTINKILEKSKKEYNIKFDLLNEIYIKKVNYYMKGEILYKIAMALNLFNVTITKLEYKEKGSKKIFELLAVSENNRNITELIKYLVKNFNYEISISIINFKKIEGLNLYVSDISISLE